MSTLDNLSDIVNQLDEGVTTEIESTIPSPETLKAKTTDRILSIAGRIDGSEYCDCVYLEEEGGYAYRRKSNSTWRFMRTKDFEDNFEIHIVVNMDPIYTAIKHMMGETTLWRDRYKKAVSVMGLKSRRRLRKLITE